MTSQKQFAKLEAATTEDVDIGTAVGQDLLRKIKYVIILSQGITPFKKLVLIVRPHPIRIIERRIRKGAHVVPIFLVVEMMGKITQNVSGKSASRIGIKLKEDDEFDFKHVEHPRMMTSY